MIFRQQVSGDFLGSNESAFEIGQFHGIDYSGECLPGRQTVEPVRASARHPPSGEPHGNGGDAALTRATRLATETDFGESGQGRAGMARQVGGAG